MLQFAAAGDISFIEDPHVYRSSGYKDVEKVIAPHHASLRRGSEQAGFFVFSPIRVVLNNRDVEVLVRQLRFHFTTHRGFVPLSHVNDLLGKHGLKGPDTGRINRLMGMLISMGLGVVAIAPPFAGTERPVFLYAFHPDVITVEGYEFASGFNRLWDTVVAGYVGRPSARPRLTQVRFASRRHPNITDRLEGFLDVLEHYFDGHGVQAHPRLLDQTRYAGGRATLKGAARYIEAIFGHSVAASTILSYLKPVRHGSKQAQRHKS